MSPMAPPPTLRPLTLSMRPQTKPAARRWARGPVAMWARRHLHREVARETVRCRHQALDRILLRPSSSFAGDPEECRRADGGPDEPGIGNVFESADNRAAFSGSFYGHARGA